MKTVQTCAECGDWYTIDLPGERRRPRLCLGCTTPAAVGRVKAADIVRATEIAMDINAAAAVTAPSDAARLWRYLDKKTPLDEFDLRDVTGWGGRMVEDTIDRLIIDGHAAEHPGGGIVRRRWSLTGHSGCKEQARGLDREGVAFSGRCTARGSVISHGLMFAKTGVGCCRAGALADLHRRNAHLPWAGR